MTDGITKLVKARTCSTNGCDRGGKLTRGMCTKHYQYWIDHTPPGERPVAPRFVDDFWTNVRKSHEFGCWVWGGSTLGRGYGYWRHTLAHRESWRRAHGEIPSGLWVLHHCDNPPCVNPAHLYLGTVLENVRDMIERGRQYVPPLKTRCDYGHELVGENLRVVGESKTRHCRTCDNERSAAWQAKRRRAEGVQLRDFVSAQERALMVEMRDNGATQRMIGRKFGRAITTVRRALREGWTPSGQH